METKTIVKTINNKGRFLDIFHSIRNPEIVEHTYFIDHSIIGPIPKLTVKVKNKGGMYVYGYVAEGLFDIDEIEKELGISQSPDAEVKNIKESI